MSAAYYNEIDPYAAQWLRNLIDAGHIAPGVVDERSIEDVRPSDLRGFTQCHFFAGIGGWSYALRRAGWADDRPVWTGSCPCQPFSAAGKGAGFADERHLWPAFFHLIKECRPVVVIGEQVASKDAEPWIDLVQDDMEGLGYPFGAVPFPAAGVGAWHIRDRLYWVADSERGAAKRRGFDVGGSASGAEDQARQRQWVRPELGAGVATGKLAYPNECAGRQRGADARGGDQGGDAQPRPGLGGRQLSGRLDNADNARLERRPGSSERADQCLVGQAGVAVELGDAESERCGEARRAGPGRSQRPTDAGTEWIACRDGKSRPIEPGTSPLAHALPISMGRSGPEQQRLASMAGLDGASLKRAKEYRVGSLRGYGNAIVTEAAQAFIEAVMESA